ncbi:hypothetical protein ALO_10924 [Acetonema longum DSM 6540]|uniref:Uncharacterized protein n=1 Tax=Acetonema longum DSM 6540 TaxID=1009370 RepID=F7NJC9_9FIRM|nr:hypothetical protein ALO_10924 [Acetonema longum DSM 6540]
MRKQPKKTEFDQKFYLCYNNNVRKIFNCRFVKETVAVDIYESDLPEIGRNSGLCPAAVTKWRLLFITTAAEI